MTKQNPRPRKYASDAEKQAAYRSRAAEVCVRLEPKTMATLDSIADEIGFTRNELMQSMVKFGLTNRDWRNEGLTAHKRLPRYQENPMATKPPSAAQLAARKRFAEMARNGSLNRKRQIAAKQNAGVKRKTNPTSESYAGEFSMTVNGKTTHRWFAHTSNQWAKSHGFDYELVSNAVKHGAPVKFTKTRAIVAVDEAADGSPVTEKWEIRNLVFYRKNPVKKTVSPKPARLAGVVKRNPSSAMVKGYAVVCMHPKPHTVAITTSMVDAKKIGQDYASRENVQVAIKPVSVHKAHFA